MDGKRRVFLCLSCDMRMLESKRKLTGETQISLRLITSIRLHYNNNHEIHTYSHFIFWFSWSIFSPFDPIFHHIILLFIRPEPSLYCLTIKKFYSFYVYGEVFPLKSIIMFLGCMIWFLILQERFFECEFAEFPSFLTLMWYSFSFVWRMIQDNWPCRCYPTIHICMYLHYNVLQPAS